MCLAAAGAEPSALQSSAREEKEAAPRSSNAMTKPGRTAPTASGSTSRLSVVSTEASPSTQTHEVFPAARPWALLNAPVLLTPRSVSAENSC